MLETPPLKENRVLLSDQKDALGMPKSIISWNIDELMLKTMDKCATSFKTQIDRFGLGELKLEEWLKTGDWRDKIDDSNHHIGTTRMSESQLEGVVDKDCKVHNINNLYIAGSSVFPTSGHSNPTFTIIALGFRLAELLIADLAVEA
jgi:choline dehydrogenase-like flavoprotein